MKAIVHVEYGRPSLLQLRDVATPQIADDEVLVRVRASSVNPSDWYGVTGFIFGRLGNGLRRPKSAAAGGDLAGRVEAVGRDVEGLQPGDDVFGTSAYSWAEYTAASPQRLALKPASVSYEEAAAVPVAGTTALQALRDQAQVQPGQKVLVNGASGGVGTFAVQLAKAFGAQVTAVCSSSKVELVRSLGADSVVDYTETDFTAIGERHDVMLDIAGSRSFLASRRVLTDDATVVVIGGRMTYRRLGPLPHIAGTFLKTKGRSQTPKFFVAKINTDDLAYLGELLETGQIRAVVETTYPLRETAAALAHLGEGHAKAKIVVSVSDS
jgi:NADPH:quinone reductase-like Zn-dependent oxidoreductase